MGKPPPPETPRLVNLRGFWTEHMLGAATGEVVPLVKVSFDMEDGTTMMTQLDPDTAREMASHLMEGAARAEYEHDFWSGNKSLGIDDDLIAQMLLVVRRGEVMRHEAQSPEEDS